MTTKPWKQAGLVMAFIGAASLTQAQQSGGEQGDGHGNREEMMKKYDTDGDGQLSEAERVALREARGGQGGKGKGGKGQGGNREELMKKYDTDGDGQLSEAERAVLREERGGQGGKKAGAKGEGENGEAI